MPQGFYQQLGLDPGASPREIREHYARTAALLDRRRRALVDQGGDATRLDLDRARLDEAWEVLSDPVRRRRYDAMLSALEHGWTDAPGELWPRVAGALVHPAAAAAADLLRVTTTLAVGVLPPAPRPGDAALRLDPADEPTEIERSGPVTVASEEQETEPDEAEVLPLPTASPLRVQPAAFQVVDGSPEATDVLVMPQAEARRPVDVSAEEIARMVDEHGYSGALLRQVREARGLSLQDVSDTTRISVRYLEALETDDHEALPSATFVRGYVREVGRMLGLAVDDVVSGYMRRFSV